VVSKITDKKIITCGLVTFAFIYIGINTEVFHNFFSVIRPFINGFILAYLTDIVVSKITGKTQSKIFRIFCILVVYFAVVAIIIVFISYIIPIISKNTGYLLIRLPYYLDFIELPTISQIISEFSILEITAGYGTSLLGFTGYAKQATTSIINVILTFVISIYALLTKDNIFTFFTRLGNLLFPQKSTMLFNTLKKSHQVFQQFLLAQLLASLLLGIITGIVLRIIGINYAFLIGTIIGLTNIIPLFGAVIGLILSLIIIFLSAPLVLAGASLAFLLLLQQVDATIITPKLMGNVLNLNPIIVILAMILGATYFGVVGILFAVPVTVMVREILREKLE